MAEKREDLRRQSTGKDADVEDALHEWWKMTVQRPAPLNEKILCEKVSPIAENAGHTDLRAMAGWLSRWKVGNGIMFTKPAVEAGDIDVDMVRHCVADVLPEILRTYAPSNILNAEKTRI